MQQPTSTMHGQTPGPPRWRAGPWIGRHALHAAAITITHPRTGQPLTVRSPVPPDFLQAMAQLGLQHVPGAEFGPSAGEEGSAAQAAAATQGLGA